MHLNKNSTSVESKSGALHIGYSMSPPGGHFIAVFNQGAK